MVHRATYCGVVAVVQLHLLSSSHPQKVSPAPLAAAGQREEPLPLPPSRPPPPQLLRLQNFPISNPFFIRFSAPCSINHFLVLPGSAASVVSCQSPQSGCPGSRNPRPAAEKILDFVLRQIFLFSSRGDKLSVNRLCMWLLSSRESEAIYSSGLFLPISCPTQARGKSCSRFI